jgi:hypothetical protein
MPDRILVVFAIASGALVVLMAASRWRIHQKAGHPGWTALVPFYNDYVLVVKICGFSSVWFWYSVVPTVVAVIVKICGVPPPVVGCWFIVISLFGFVVALVLYCRLAFRLAAKFGWDDEYGFGLLLLPFVFYPLLAFGAAEYQWEWDRASDDRDDHDRVKPWTQRNDGAGQPRKTKARRDDNW